MRLRSMRWCGMPCRTRLAISRRIGHCAFSKSAAGPAARRRTWRRCCSAEGVEYTFSDISPLFLARARERFARFPFLRYQALDIERDPDPQGFAEGHFDIILASNVLHATGDLRQTLERVRRLLAPGGLLILLEVTRPERWIDLTFRDDGGLVADDGS